MFEALQVSCEYNLSYRTVFKSFFKKHLSDQRIFIQPGGDRYNNFQPTMNYKRDLPFELQSSSSRPAPQPASPLSSQPAPQAASQPVSQPSPSLLRNDIEIETESSDDDLPRMPDTTSEEEIDNPEEVDFEVHQEDDESVRHSQPLFQSSAPSNASSNRRSLRYFESFVCLKNYNSKLKGVKL